MASDKIQIALEQDTNARPIEISVLQDDCEVISATVLTGFSSDVPGQILERIEAIEALIPAEATPENQLADKEYVNGAVGTVANSVTELTGRVGALETCCEDLTQKVATNAGNIAQNASSIASVQAQLAEAEETIADNTSKIQAETTRATEAEQNIQNALDAEVKRAEAAEQDLSSQISAETERATGAEAELQDAITAETSRAESVEQGLDTKIQSVESHLETFEEEVAADKTELKNAISAETTRATKAEGDLQTAITTEVQRATAAESALGADIQAETQRATGVENTLTAAISAETTRAESAESDLEDKITAETQRAEGAESALDSRVSTIEGKIPTQASATNQLADKAFVNSSIQTASAHFRGNWPTFADVPSIATAYPVDGTGSTTPTMNDYLVVEADENENGETWRYKYIGDWATNGKSGWRAEYKVNDTPLTAAQLAAINSNITTDGVAQITTNQNNIESLTQQVASNTAALESAQGKLTPAQLAAVNSGVTSDTVAQVATNKSDIAAETARATGAESQLQTAITAEQTRAEGAESALDKKISDETTRATGVESGLDTRITQNATAIAGLDSSKQDNLTTAQLAAVNSGVTSASVAQIATNKSDITTLSSTKADKTEIADMLTATDAAGIYETQAAATSAHNSLSGEISTLSGTVAQKANTADVEANYATKSALAETSAQVATNTQDITEAMADIAALGADKQDKLTAGDNITIENNVISATGGGSGAGRNVGDVFYTERLDNELSGAVERNGAEYNIADVNGGNNNLQDLLTRGALPYKPYSAWQEIVDRDGFCDSFAWDGGNTFKVPLSKRRVLVRSKAATADDPSWYNVFSDGWCEQGGATPVAPMAGTKTVILPIVMQDALYYANSIPTVASNGYVFRTINRTPTQFQIGPDVFSSPANPTGSILWEASGYADQSEYTGDNSTFYDGQPVQRPMVQLFNGVTDSALATCTGVLADVAGLKEKVAIAFAAGGRYLVRKKAPTASDPSWYNVYSDGWVEQGGYNDTSRNTVTLPVLMRDTSYDVSVTPGKNGSNSSPRIFVEKTECTTSSFVIHYNSYTAAEQAGYWNVIGYAAPTEYTRDKWGDDTDYSTISVMTGDPSPFKFKAWTNEDGQTVYTLLAVPIARGDDMYTEDQLAVYNNWDANQSTAPLPKVEDRCGALGIVNGNRAINGGGVPMGTPGTLDPATAYVRNQALDTNG